LAGKIRTYEPREKDGRIQLEVPVDWLKDMKRKFGAYEVDLLRDEEDRLILVAHNKEEVTKR